MLATLWFNVAHYSLRPWPWIVTALAALVLIPDLAGREKPGSAYIEMFMKPDVFPASLRGFMIAAFAAAYMSTIATHLNWGASYVINDFYRPFARLGASERHYVLASQATTVLLMLISIGVYFLLDTIEGAWKVLFVTGAGTGTVYLLRWYWWRINAWSEVSAMVVAAGVSLFLQLGWLKWDRDDPHQFAYLMLTTVAVTTIAWVAVTFLTKPEPRELLKEFYARARPAGPGWAPIRALFDQRDAQPTESLAEQFVNWLLGCVLIYTSLFGIGYLVFKEWAWGIGLTLAAVACGVAISHNLSKALGREGA
jgi:Na+/proline symporter